MLHSSAHRGSRHLFFCYPALAIRKLRKSANMSTQKNLADKWAWKQHRLGLFASQQIALSHRSDRFAGIRAHPRRDHACFFILVGGRPSTKVVTYCSSGQAATRCLYQNMVDVAKLVCRADRLATRNPSILRYNLYVPSRSTRQQVLDTNVKQTNSTWNLEGYLRNKKWYLIRSAHAVYICNEKLSMTRI